MKPIRKFRKVVRRHNVSEGGQSAYSFGIRLGYWPCMKAPFIQFAFLFWVVSIWHGLPSREGMKLGQ